MTFFDDPARGHKVPREKPTRPIPRPQSSAGLAPRMTRTPELDERSYRGSGRLRGRRALITGADSGIGRAAAIAFAREGADVAINYLPAAKGDADEVAAAIRAAGRKVVMLPGDIRDETFCRLLVERALGDLGGIDVLVNNASRQVAQPSLMDISSAQFDEVFKTNVYAMFWITKAALPHLQPGASIINTTSVAAYEPTGTAVDYAASKGAIMVFSKGLARQLAPRGIRVNAVAPGPAWTFAGIYVLLASAESANTTGQVYGGRA